MGVAMVVIVAVIAVFLVRLVDIQIVQANALNQASYDNMSHNTVAFGQRGDIVDRDGQVLASAVMRYTITLSPKQAAGFDRVVDKDAKTTESVTVEQAAQELATATGQTPEAVLALITTDPTSDYAVVAKEVDLAVFNAVRALDIPWIYYESNQSRTYPQGSVGGNLVGFVGTDGDALAGLEALDDSCLAGTDGIVSSELGADGVRIPGSTVTTKEAKDGGQLVTTINSDLQYFSQEVLAQRVQEVGGESGTATVMDSKTGELLAVAEYPTVDPNNRDATPAEYRGSQAFTAPFEPGSTFKTFTAAALVDAGLATPTTQVLAPFEYDAPNGAIIRDSFVHPDQRLTFAGVMQQSSNTGISQLSEAMTLQQRWDYMKKFHLGQPSEVGFLGEEDGTIRTPEEWDNQTAYNTTFGQGLTVTAVQLASIYQTIANGGVRMPVSLVSGCKQTDGTVTDVPSTTGEQVISASAAEQTIQMLETVATTGYAAPDVAVPGYRVATKTGTAEMSDGNGEYGHLYLTSLSGLAPADNPRFVVSVTVSKPVTITSGLAAAPVFQKIMSQVLKMYRVPPSTDSAPDIPTTY